MHNVLVLIFYYFVILISILGFGLFFLGLFKKQLSGSNFGYVGLCGIYLLLLYSYLSNFVLAHSELHNILLHILGITLFFSKIFNNLSKYKKEFFLTFLVFLFISSSLFMYKNHDDFPYYHFPYTYYLTQQSFYIGIGQFNHGFRTPSSIFYLSSLFYLPHAKFYLFHFSSIYILGFANIVLLKNINSYFTYWKFKKENVDITNYLSLFSIIFINIFFYRIAEHGTDRSAQILIFLFIIELLIFMNLKHIKSINLFNLYLLAALIISLKAFYILYAVFLIPLFFFVKSRSQNYSKTIIFLIFNKFFSLFLLLLSFVLFTYFINTGCIIYPLSITCFNDVNWGITTNEVIKMNNHYELWSKAGNTPTSRVSNPSEYIEGFYWVKNWVNMYFFNKVSDFILGLITVIIIVVFFFKKQFFKKEIKKYRVHQYLIYLIIIILGIEWFYNHPALRYGGYCIIALLLFIPVCLKLDINNIDYKNYNRSVIILIIATIIIFNIRNFNRIIKEIKFYNYKPIQEGFYFVEDGNFRIQKNMKKLIILYNDCLNLKEQCSLENQKIYKRYGKIIFNNRMHD
ncbi:hypothetical protein OAB10_01795 [Candidatus Pelagibacter sp.]|nr:hypothetical protein [Candidatus Pelagibacter sp.]